MKLSKYNYLIPQSNNITYWFNGISQQYFSLEANLSQKILNLLQIESGYQRLEQQSHNFAQKLLDGGFVVDDDFDEIQCIRNNFESECNSKDYKLSILPTLNCNYNCWYCVQDHIESKMSIKTIEKIKRHIIRIIEIEKIASLNIDWFGGEPLMFFSDIVEPISRFAKVQCDKAKIPFVNTITTNAYYLMPYVCCRLDELNFKVMQITLDGRRNTHNSVKKASNGESAFDIALDHIDAALSASKSLVIMLRINYANGTLCDELLSQICEHISTPNRKRTQIMLRKVWQVSRNSDRKSIVREFMQKAIDNGFSVRANNFVGAIPCYADKKYYACINYNGEVVRCTASNELYQNAPGYLNDEGFVVWRSTTTKYGSPNFENDNCLSCKHLPLCLGGCNNHRHEPNAKFICEQENRDFSFEESIENYIEYDTASNN